MYACMYVCMHACMYVCMYVYTYICMSHTHNIPSSVRMPGTRTEDSDASRGAGSVGKTVAPALTRKVSASNVISAFWVNVM
jgi:hypothetical protein